MPGGRFRRAEGRGYEGMGRIEQGGPERPFFFVQMADTQLGLASKHGSWEDELELCRRAVEEVNRLRPAFAIVCGDMIDEFPGEENVDERQRRRPSAERRARQKRDFVNTMNLIHDDIPLLCVCGNHDVGNRPNAATLSDYTETFGDDYYAFWCQGVRCLVVNSQLWVDGSDAPEEADAQERWLDEQLAVQDRDAADDVGLSDQVAAGGGAPATAEDGKEPASDELSSPRADRSTAADSADSAPAAPSRQRTLIFSHVPPFLSSPDERDGYFNLRRGLRKRMLKRFCECGAVAWFSGHYHENAGGVYRHPDGSELEVVVTGAVGAQIPHRPSAIGHVPDGISQEELDENGDLFSLSGKDFSCFPANEDVSGLRIVRVLEDGVHHEWRTFSELRRLSKVDLALPT